MGNNCPQWDYEKTLSLHVLSHVQYVAIACSYWNYGMISTKLLMRKTYSCMKRLQIVFYNYTFLTKGKENSNWMPIVKNTFAIALK